MDFNLNEEVKSIMSKAAASINVNQFKTAVDAANKHSNALKDISFPNVTEILANYQQVQLGGIQKAVESIQKEAARSFPNQAKAIDKIYDNGWSVGYSNEIIRKVFSEPEFFWEMRDDDVNNFFINTFSDRHTLKNELYNTSEILDNYGDLLKIMGTILERQESSECWKVFYPQLFAILDRMMVYQVQGYSLSNSEITRRKDVRNFQKNVMKKDNTNDILNYIYVRTLNEIVKYWERSDFEKENVSYSRHSVQHGRYDPSNYTFNQFIKLVLSISALSLFNE